MAKDTAIYGLSSIVGRFLNWLLVPLYTIKLAEADYGVVTNLYAYVALTIIVLTYGMETGFFRFINREDCKEPMKVYSTLLIALASTSVLFIIGVFAFLSPLSRALDCAAHPSYIWMLAVAVGVDAFSSIPFCYLRYQSKAVKFAVLKLINIGINIGLNLIFFLVIFNPEIGQGYIFFANMIASLALIPLLWRELRGFPWRFDGALFRRMFKYSFPLLILGIAGNMNQNLDKIIFPFLMKDSPDGMAQLGIYGACCKVALVMMMFTQAYRFA
ncbi:MAG: oligosaccharide flippase family protein [Muribaculaceae bacterium]|nr:oligosaccharide flippase family protein [Muribaculaceae bacterium]